MKLPERLIRKVRYQSERSEKGGYISYVAHLRAWVIYNAIYSVNQSADKIAERGGFGQEELDLFYPEWRNHIIINHP